MSYYDGHPLELRDGKLCYRNKWFDYQREHPEVQATPKEWIDYEGSVLDFLETERVLKVELDEKGFRLIDGCDQYFDFVLTKDVMRLLIKELTELVENEAT